MEDLKRNLKKALLITLTCLVIGSAEVISWYYLKLLINGGSDYNVLSISVLMGLNGALTLIFLGLKAEG